MLIFIFAILNSILLLSPAFLKTPFPNMPLLRLGDVTDILTPLILIPLYFLLFRASVLPTKKQILAFLIFAGLLAEGQGMHLSANSIDNWLMVPKTSDLFILVHFFDEFLSHYLWFIGVNGITALLLIRQMENSEKQSRGILLIIFSSILYGVTYFITTVEAQISPIGIPFALAVAIFGIYNRGKLKVQSLLLFYFVAHLLALILFLGWYLYFGGLPEFSSLGLV